MRVLVWPAAVVLLIAGLFFFPAAIKCKRRANRPGLAIVSRLSDSVKTVTLRRTVAGGGRTEIVLRAL